MKATLKVKDHSEKFYAIEGSDYVFPKSLAESVTVDQEWIPKTGEWAFVVKTYDTGESLTGQYYKVGEVFNIKKVEKSGIPRVGYWLYKSDGCEASLSACRPALPHEIPAEARPDFKGWCVERTPENAEVLNAWANNFFGCNLKWNQGYILSEQVEGSCQDSKLHEGFILLPTAEAFFEKVGYKPESELVDIVRKSLGFYEGVEVFEDTKSWHINLKTLEIKESIGNDVALMEAIFDDSSKDYLTPAAANARLREEVEKKARHVKFSIEEYEAWDMKRFNYHSPHEYAIFLVEKEYNVQYLTEK